MELVSVIIPVFNVEEYVEEAVKSVLNQTHLALEIIIVNDGSTDSSMSLVRTFTDLRIQVIEQTNKGLASARNTGIANSNGRYIALLDSDDIWLPNKIEIQLAHLKSSLDVGVSYGTSQFIDEKGNPTGFYQRYSSLKINAVDLLLSNPVGNGSSPLIRREAMEDLIAKDPNSRGLLFDPDFRRFEDLECWMRLALMTNWKFEGVPECLVKYRLRTSSLSGNFHAQYESFEQLLRKLFTYAPEIASQYQYQARARQLRIGAHAALRAFKPDEAKAFIIRAVKMEPSIIFNGRLRVISIFIRLYLQKILSKEQYFQMERFVARKKESFH